MRDLSDKNFGIAIAYLIPGFVVLWGFSYFSATIGRWLGAQSSTAEPTIGSFLYVLLASLAAGLIVSALRWAIIDTFHHATGVRAPKLDFTCLRDKIDPFLVVVEANYRFYQFYANMALAIAIGAICRLASIGNADSVGAWFGLIVLEGVLIAGSRDSLLRYYERASAVLGELDTPADDESFE